MTSKINLKTLFTMPMAPPPNKLSLHAKQFEGKTKERQCCARFTAVIAVYGRTELPVPCPRAWPSLLRAHNHIGGATAVPLHHKKCLLCSVLIYMVVGQMTEIFVSGTEVFSDDKMTETPSNDGGLTCMDNM